MSFIFWKEEPQTRKWKWIPNTHLARAGAIKSGAMFFTWTAFSCQPGNGSEPMRFGHLPLDFDNKADPERALDEMRNLCLIVLLESFEIDAHEIQFFCSGAKGFHAVIPSYVIGSEAGHPKLPLIYKAMVHRWAESLKLKTLDLTMYAMGAGKMFRIPNVKRQNGRYKVPLSLEEVRSMSFKDLWEMSEYPREEFHGDAFESFL
ncbi:MAG: hypothetical protein V1714_01595 [Pseudomonadota bacterium]